MKQLQNSHIRWQDKTPFSEQFEDYYFNSEGGISETQQVFITPSKIAERYQHSASSFFCINETGFGTGLNLYATLTAIEQLSKLKNTKPLYFYSSELFPLSLKDFTKAVASFPQFYDITRQICQQYPPPIKGFHRLVLNAGSVYLTLLFDDSLSAYQQCNHSADAWYLDGFSPAKNSAMWQEPLFEQIARLSTLNRTSIATFTAAGFVRRALQAQGFSITKHKGSGKKRETVSGLLTSTTASAEQLRGRPAKPWFTISPSSPLIRHVAIIGSGLAGCTSAEALARRGIEVTLYDSSGDICQHASGNRQGALYAKLPSKPTLSGDLHLTGLEYSLRLLNIYQCFDNQTAQQCGLLQLATTEKEQIQQQDLLDQGYYACDVVRSVNAEQASELAGTKTPFGGLYFERAGWVDPGAFCRKILATHKINYKLLTTVSELEQLADNRWQLVDDKGLSFQYDAVIVANANSAASFSQLKDMPIKGIRGQVTHAQSASDPSLKTVVCGAGYISPALGGEYCFGASFDLHHQDLHLKRQDQTNNIKNLHNVLPQLHQNLAFAEQLNGKVAMRCSTPDYLPVVGPVPCYEDYITSYAKLRKDKNWNFKPHQAPNYQGLFVNIGHGSKGLITCPLTAEYLACTITNQPSPMAADLSNAIHPARFVIKQLIRRTI